MNPSALLRLARGLRVDCESGTEFLLRADSRKVRGGAFALALLDAFRTPRSMNGVLAEFRGRLTGTQDWIELTQQLLLLHRGGILVDAEAAEADATLSDRASFGAPSIHIRMLNDRERTRRYLDAIASVVQPGDVVVDLGTGSGILAVAAARAGARRVYAIEATTIAHAARRVFAENNVADRISLVEGHSTQVQLPERADVLVSEIIGNEPLSEKILESTADAVRRFLKPDARLIPRALRVQAYPVEMPENYRDGFRVSAAALENWRRDYGVDFSALAELSRRTPGHLQLKPSQIADWPALAKSACIADYDLTRSVHEQRTATATFECVRGGLMDAVALWFEADLAPGQTLSTDPATPRADNHWSHPVHILGDALDVRDGDRVLLNIDAGSPPQVRAQVVDN